MELRTITQELLIIVVQSEERGTEVGDGEGREERSDVATNHPVINDAIDGAEFQ